jgi:hypothetical protein
VQVILVWSIKTGKTKVIWNKSDISHLFPEKQQSDKVQFSWESRSGETFQIVAHRKQTSINPQYNFLVGSTSFFSLPHVSELRVIETEGDICDPAYVRDLQHHSEIRTQGSADCELQDNEEMPLDLGFRLSMAGLAPNATVGTFDDLEDELTSDFFQHNLESLRQRVTASIPEAEDMVSRAIVNAFSEDRDSQTSFDSSSSCGSLAQTPIQIEADAIWETTEWIALNVDYAPCPDVEDQKRVFMQKQIDAVFMHVRNERLNEDTATFVLSRVGTLLGMRLTNPVPIDTLILNDLDKNVDVETLIGSLCAFGEVKEAAVSVGRRFGKRGICTLQNLDHFTTGCLTKVVSSFV